MIENTNKDNDIEFKEVKSRNAERKERKVDRSAGVKRMCAYLEEKGDETKIGGMIKNELPRIRREAGGPVFVSYKTETEAGSMGEWLETHPELALMESQGSGWYIWSYKADVTLKVKGDLREASEKRESKQRSWERRNDRTAVLVMDRPKEKTVPKEMDFPAVLGTGREQGLRGAWTGGKTVVTNVTKGSKKGRVVLVDGPMEISDQRPNVSHILIPATALAVTAPRSSALEVPKVDSWDDE